MAVSEMSYISSSDSGGTLKDIIRDKVLNGGYTPICTLSAFQDRATLNEGGMVADTENHRVYVYVDFTAEANFGSAGDYASVFLFNNISTNYYPVYNDGTRANSMPFFTDDASVNPQMEFYFGYNTGSYSNRIVLAYGAGANAVKTGDRYILYAAYTYK